MLGMTRAQNKYFWLTTLHFFYKSQIDRFFGFTLGHYYSLFCALNLVRSTHRVVGRPVLQSSFNEKWSN